MFHVFTDNIDEHTMDLLAALTLFRTWKREVGCARLYLEVYENVEDEPVLEECILSHGRYPA
jgi:hypothetical protein